MDGDMFSKISAMLDDPGTAEKLKQVASSIGLGEDSSGGEQGSPELPAMLKSVGGNKNIALLQAITPYLRPSRANKIDSAIRAIQVLSVISSLK